MHLQTVENFFGQDHPPCQGEHLHCQFGGGVALAVHRNGDGLVLVIGHLDLHLSAPVEVDDILQFGEDVAV